MKTLTIILSLIISSVALADEPAELAKLRATYDNSLRGEFQKVGKLYHKELLQLKKNYMQAENLEGAVAVDAEIKKLRETHGKMVVKAPEPQEKASPLDGAWVVHARGHAYLFVFNEDKVADNRGWVWKWSQDNGFIVATREDGHYHKVKSDPSDPNLMTGINSSGDKLTYKRLKW
jgi:hypothetical protein